MSDVDNLLLDYQDRCYELAQENMEIGFYEFRLLCDGDDELNNISLMLSFSFGVNKSIANVVEADS